MYKCQCLHGCERGRNLGVWMLGNRILKVIQQNHSNLLFSFPFCLLINIILGADLFYLSAWKNYLRNEKFVTKNPKLSSSPNNCALNSFFFCAWLSIDPYITAYNTPEYRFYLVGILLFLDWIREYADWQSAYSGIQSKCEDMRTRWNPYSGYFTHSII